MIDIKSIISELQMFSNDILRLNKPAEPSLITDFEEQHQITLPKDYKSLLNHTNGFSLMGSEILGLSNDGHSYSLESAYQIEHYKVGNPQPKYLVPFHNDGGGNFYCFDTRTLDANSCKIVFWQYDLDYTLEEPEIVNDSLVEWIQEIVIDWTLEDYNYDGTER
jgi:hypothetical protein